MPRRPRSPLGRRPLALVGLIALLAAMPGSTGAAVPTFKTSQAPMLNPVIPRAWVDPIITTGEMIGGYRFEAIPDGIAVRSDRRGRVQVFVNHETSTVPFPYANDPAATPPTSPNPGNSQNDFDNSQLSKLVVATDNARIVSASMAITSAQGFQRFCSNFLANRTHGFERELLLTNEEAVDWVNKTVPSWPAVEGAPEARQSGVVVAYDPRNGQTRPIWGMGRHNHENSVAIPGYGKPVVLSGDDTFVNTPSQSQLFMYIARNAQGVWDDTGDLWAFASTGTQQSYEMFSPFDPAGTSTTGQFKKVPKFIATGRDPVTGNDLTSTRAEELLAAAGLPVTPGDYAPPTDGSFSRPPGKTTGPSVDGPQWVLERWSQLNGVFKFIRLEDIAYDKRSGRSNVVYIVDSGRGTAAAAPAAGTSTNGRVWQMVLDKKDPTKVTSLSVLIEGDDSVVKTPGEIHQPDNIESTRNGLYITEDPGSSQQFNYSEAQLADGRRTEARIWQYRFSTKSARVAFKVDQSADEGPTDVDVPPTTLPPGASARGNLGAWEASGIIDVSEWFGSGTFLVAVQAHTLFVETQPGLDVTGDGTPDILNKREGGQLLLVRIPGG